MAVDCFEFPVGGLEPFLIPYYTHLFPHNCLQTLFSFRGFYSLLSWRVNPILVKVAEYFINADTAAIHDFFGPIHDALAKYYAFEQGITGQAVGAVYSGTGGFTAGIKGINSGFSISAGFNSSHDIVSGGRNGYLLPGDVNAAFPAGTVDIGEAFFHLLYAAHVQVDIFAAAAIHLIYNGPGYDVAGGQLGQGMVSGHKTLSFMIVEQASFSSNRFGNEKSLVAITEKYCRVKLNKFHVAESATGAVGGGHAVSGSYAGIGGVTIELPGSAGSNNGGFGDISQLLPGFGVINQGTVAFLALVMP